ncbi:MAG: molybdenum cofactor guanylyltransferase [FCB group bacterium]|nr:molybdenum cofactor guanylyltransferase [FCB group bacterium]
MKQGHQRNIEVKRTKRHRSTEARPSPIVEVPVNQTDHCCAILAGGQSSRMGLNKALMKIDGLPLIERVVETVKKQVGNPVIIAREPGKYAFLNLPSHVDIIANAGPLGGIYTALTYSHSSHCLVLACDLPFLSGYLIRMLLDQGSSYDVLVVDAGKGVEPLCAVYSKDCIPVIKNQIQSGNLKITDLYTKIRTRIIYLKKIKHKFNAHILFNINTPKDLEIAREINRKASRSDEFVS